ncbi:MAG TPA: T9SS type A sorting domain-containing protein [Ignavibacteriaceae bacterium]|nr:T9SS type A sorting domain-containing protein [Ignavibacteriaceae bacterium]
MKKSLLVLVLLFVMINVVNAQTKHIVQATNSGFQFIPMNVDITVGDTVEFQWLDGSHTTTSDNTSGQNVWDAPLTVSSPTFSVVITAPGIHHYHCIPHQSLGMVGTITASSPTAVDDQKLNLSTFNLYQNYPNPFNPSTIISYSIPSASQVNLTVYNALGQQVAELVNQNQAAGAHSVVFNSSVLSGLSSGIYFYRLKAGSLDKTRKMLLIK